MPRRRTAVVLACVLLCSWPGAAQELTQPAVLRDVGIDQHLDAQVPLDLTFRDETGASVRLGDYFGTKPVILTLVYYECPMLCTVILNGLVGALRALKFTIGDQFDMVTVSFNPTETPALAAAKKDNYLQRYGRPGAADGWHFLTGDEPAIRQLADTVGFRYTYVPERKEYAHAAGITVLTPAGKIARYFFGVEFAPRDLRLALVEASQNKIGTPIDQLLLYCFHYDPVTGSYAAAAMNIVRLGGGVTVIALAAFLLAMRRRERRRAAEAVG